MDEIKRTGIGNSPCNLCPRECMAKRDQGQAGYCLMDNRIFLARAALHMWEEPCISGKRGSGTVFFSGCNLRCVYCQNYEIAAGSRGKEVSAGRLSEIFFGITGKRGCQYQPCHAGSLSDCGGTGGGFGEAKRADTARGI